MRLPRQARAAIKANNQKRAKAITTKKQEANYQKELHRAPDGPKYPAKVIL